MNKVITINLAGRAYALEESGFDSLRAYLDQAAKKLEGNPDKEEILKDFELAIADRCESYIQPNKNVITATEIQEIIKAMGPVEGTSGKTEETGTASTDAGRSKKLYRIREGQMIGGVCNGLAAYFDLDVTLIRIIFVILAVLTQGAWILVYLIMLFVVPVAETSTEKERAFGTFTMTAKELMQNAKEGYTNFKNSNEWRRWKHQMKEEKKRWKYERKMSYRPSPFWEIAQGILGLVWVAFILFLTWFAYNNIGPVHDFFDTLGLAFQELMEQIRARMQS